MEITMILHIRSVALVKVNGGLVAEILGFPMIYDMPLVSSDSHHEGHITRICVPLILA